jgi:hypothetical protein
MKRLAHFVVTLTIVLLTWTSTAVAAVAMDQKFFRYAEDSGGLIFPTITPTGNYLFLVVASATPATGYECRANDQAFVPVAANSNVSVVAANAGGYSSFTIQCTALPYPSLVGVFDVSGAAGTADVASATSTSLSVLMPRVAITITVDKSLIIGYAYSYISTGKYRTTKNVPLSPLPMGGYQRLAYRYRHPLTDLSTHNAFGFETKDFLGDLGVNVVTMLGGTAGNYNISTGGWTMRAVAIHPSL